MKVKTQDELGVCVGGDLFLLMSSVLCNLPRQSRDCPLGICRKDAPLLETPRGRPHRPNPEEPVEHSLREPAQGGRQMGSSAVTSEPAPEPECGWNLSSHSTNSCSLRQKPIYAGQEVLDRKFRKLYHHSVCALCT